MVISFQPFTCTFDSNSSGHYYKKVGSLQRKCGWSSKQNVGGALINGWIN